MISGFKICEVVFNAHASLDFKASWTAGSTKCGIASLS